jgi:hypothetical protein
VIFNGLILNIKPQTLIFSLVFPSMKTDIFHFSFLIVHCYFFTQRRQVAKVAPSDLRLKQALIFYLGAVAFPRINIKLWTLNFKLLNFPLLFAFCLLPLPLLPSYVILCALYGFGCSFLIVHCSLLLLLFHAKAPSRKGRPFGTPAASMAVYLFEFCDCFYGLTLNFEP